MARQALLEKPAAVAEEGDCTLFVRARELRGSRSLKNMAAAIGIRPDELSRIERGETRQIRFVTILSMLRAFHCSADDLLVIEGKPRTTPLYNGVMQALKDGRLKPGVPARYSDDVDRTIALFDEIEASVDDGEVEMFAEEPVKPEVTRGPFRPTAARG
jgi:DNA-binding Xre family transcriptional regulator